MTFPPQQPPQFGYFPEPPPPHETPSPATGGPPPRPQTKPGAVVASQVSLAILAALGLIEVGFLVWWFTLDLEYFPTVSMFWEFSWRFYVPNAVLAILLIALAPIILIGVAAGKGGMRIFGLVCLPILLVGNVWWILYEVNGMGYGVNALNAGGRVSIIAYMLRAPVMIWAFAMLLVPSVRAWTGANVKPRLVVTVPLSQPPQPQGHAPGGYAPQPQPPYPPQQQAPYPQQPYPPQQRPPGY